MSSHNLNNSLVFLRISTETFLCQLELVVSLCFHLSKHHKMNVLYFPKQLFIK